MDAFFANLLPLLRETLNGPHGPVFVVVAVLTLLLSLGALVAWASKGDAAASAALKQRAAALRERAPDQAVAPQR